MPGVARSLRSPWRPQLQPPDTSYPLQQYVANLGACAVPVDQHYQLWRKICHLSGTGCTRG